MQKQRIRLFVLDNNSNYASSRYINRSLVGKKAVVALCTVVVAMITMLGNVSQCSLLAAQDV